jgi:peptidyl-prolyl cis-trans isomerase C
MLLCFLLFPAALYAQEDDPVLLSNNVTAVKLSDYQAELTRLPENMRGGFAANKKRADQLLRNLLETKTLAVMAEEDGLGKIPENRAILELERQRNLSRFAINKVREDALKSFEESRAQYETRAKEKYVLEKNRYTTPAQVKASHILISKEKHGAEEGKKIAAEVLKQARAGKDFNELAAEFSEDPSVKENRGALGWFAQGKMVPEFSDAAFALNEGGISDIVETRYGWHIIRVEEKKEERRATFEEVRSDIMEELKKEFADDQQNWLIAKIRNDPALVVNEKNIEEYVYVQPPSQEQINKAVEAILKKP